jgi:hypothetical protein
MLTYQACDKHIHKLSLKPIWKVKCYKRYEVNGFWFYTDEYSEQKLTMNSEVCVRSECTDDT